MTMPAFDKFIVREFETDVYEDILKKLDLAWSVTNDYVNRFTIMLKGGHDSEEIKSKMMDHASLWRNALHDVRYNCILIDLSESHDLIEKFLTTDEVYKYNSDVIELTKKFKQLSAFAKDLYEELVENDILFSSFHIMTAKEQLEKVTKFQQIFTRYYTEYSLQKNAADSKILQARKLISELKSKE